MRSSTVANEHGHDPDHIERQLAHLDGNKVRAPYDRSQYLADRTKLMQWWADNLERKRTGPMVQTDGYRAGFKVSDGAAASRG